MQTTELKQWLEDLGAPDWRVREAAHGHLFAQGEAALETLLTGLAHPNWRVRKGCAALMDHLADERCVEPLLRLLRDPIASVRRLAMHSLSCQGCKKCPLSVDVVAHLIERAMQDPSPRVRRAVVHQLGCQPSDPRAAAALQALLEQETDPKLLSRARWALQRHEARG